MRVHYFQHVPFEGLGYIELWLREHQHTISVTRFYENDYQLPAIDTIDLLIVMGGPMGVYDEDIHPWLIAEKAFITACIQAGKKILGICLGAQLTSVCLNGEVKAAENKEIGWFPVEPVPNTVPWFYELLKDKPVLFHWHGDQFSIPSGALDLAFTAANRNQAFLYEDRILGLQFHLECMPENIKAMLAHFEDEVGEYVQEPAVIASGVDYCAVMNGMMAVILNRFCR
jgi:GMP synthase-like glutamine amidotransferase